MNPDEVFALLRRADPATDVTREDLPVTSFNPEPSRPRPWVRPLAYAAAAALVVTLAIGPLGLIGGDGDVIEQPTTTLSPPTTAPGTTPSTSATTTTPPTTTVTTIPEAAGGLVIANGETITWGDGDVTPGLDVPAKVVYDDLAGGVVYQVALPIVGDTGDSTIYHLPAGATQPQVLMAPSGSSWTLLQNVLRVDGSPTALVVERRQAESFENATDALFEVDLITGERREIAVVGGWESGLSAISWDGSTYVTSSFNEAYTFVSRLDRDGTITPWEGAIPGECFDDSSCPTKVVASADGERLVMFRVGQLVEWDRTTDAEVQAVDLPEGIYVAPILSGDSVVLNRFSEMFDSDYGVAVMVDLTDGSVSEAPYAGFADWIDGPATDVELVGTGIAGLTPSLEFDGVEQLAANACGGADGAIVFVFEDGRRAMVGFEDGTFIRYIDAEGGVFETADVVYEEITGFEMYSGEVETGGGSLRVGIVVPIDVPSAGDYPDIAEIPECTP